jgi:hypothetical protein
MIGWEQTSDTSYHRLWLNERGDQHVIVVALVQGGWMYKWQRGYTLTVDEAGGYATLEACMAAIWINVFALYDRCHDLTVAEARRIVRAS